MIDRNLDNAISDILGSGNLGEWDRNKELGFIFMLGPYMMTKYEMYQGTIHRLMKYPEMEYIYHLAKVEKAYHSGGITFGQFKKCCRDQIAEFNNHYPAGHALQKAFSEWCQTHIHVCQERQKETLASESAILSFSGIGNVHNATIGKQPVNDANHIMIHHALTRCKKEFANGINAIGLCNKILSDRGPYIMKAAEKVWIPYNKGPGSWIATAVTEYGELSDLGSLGSAEFRDDLWLYFVLAGCLFEGEEIEPTLDPIFQEFAPDINTIASESFLEWANRFSKYVTDDITALEEEFLNEERMKEQSDEQIARLMDEFHKDIPPQMEKTTHIDRVLAYINTHRNIQSSQFANQMFLQESGGINLNNYSLHDDFLIAIMEDNAVVCPFIDIVDNRKMKLLCSRMPGEFFVVDGSQYIPEEGTV